MSISRRGLLGAAGLAAGGAWPAVADEGYPRAKPIRLIVGFLPGASTDFVARVLAEGLTRRLGQTVVVENRPGADSMIAVEYTVKSAPDGYILLFTNAEGAGRLEGERPTTTIRIPDDLTYICRMVKVGYALIVNSKLPITSMKELIAYAKAHPGRLRFGSAGVGGASHIEGLRLQQIAGIQMVHVPYRGAAASLVDVMAGFIDMSFMTMGTIGGNASSDKLRIIAVTSDEREPLLPDVPTMAEQGLPQAYLDDWLGLVGPPKMPKDVVATLTQATLDTLRDPDVAKRLNGADLMVAPLTGDAFAKLAASEYANWKAIAETFHIVVD